MEKVVSRFRGKLIKMIKDVDSKFDYYSVSPKIRQRLLHWDYELIEKVFFIDVTNQYIKMSYYWFNRKEIYSKEKAAEYYLKNKEAINKRSRGRHKNLPKEEKDMIKEISATDSIQKRSIIE